MLIYSITRLLTGKTKNRGQLTARSRKGFGTLEVVIIIAVLLTVALIFRKTLSDYASSLINSVFDESIIDNMGDYTLN